MQKTKRKRIIAAKRNEQKNNRKLKRFECLNNNPIEMQMSREFLEKFIILYKKQALNAKKRMDESKKVIKLVSIIRKIIFLFSVIALVKVIYPVPNFFYFIVLIFLIFIFSVLGLIRFSAEESIWSNERIYDDNRRNISRYINVLKLQVNNS